MNQLHMNAESNGASFTKTNSTVSLQYINFAITVLKVCRFLVTHEGNL